MAGATIRQIRIPYGAIASVTIAFGIANFFNTGYQHDQYQGADFAKVSDVDEVKYQIEGAHTLSANDGSPVKSYINLKTSKIFASTSEPVRFGGAGGGGLSDFDSTAWPELEEIGCKIAQDIINHEPGFLYDISWSDSYEKLEVQANSIAKLACD